MDQWVGAVAVVTGASSGIGAAITKSLAHHGIIVVAVARRQEKIEEYAKTIDGTIHARQCDLSDEEQIRALFHWINGTFDGVDILVNNAGVLKLASLVAGNTKDWSTMMNVNVLALSIATREALVSMRRKDKGHIIHINSIAGHAVPKISGIPVGMYSASKFGVTALTEGLRVELKELNSNIKVTSISPGSVYTQMVRDFAKTVSTGALAAEDATGEEKLPYGFLEERDVVEAVLYALGTRPHVQVHDILIQAIGQA